VNGLGCELGLDGVASAGGIAQLFEVLGEGRPVENVGDVRDAQLVRESVDDIGAHLHQRGIAALGDVGREQVDAMRVQVRRVISADVGQALVDEGADLGLRLGVEAGHGQSYGSAVEDAECLRGLKGFLWLGVSDPGVPVRRHLDEPGTDEVAESFTDGGAGGLQPCDQVLIVESFAGFERAVDDGVSQLLPDGVSEELSFAGRG